MTPHEAQKIIREYQAVLADDTRRGNRRDPALLPASKEELLKAIRLEIAQLYYINSATDELLRPLIRAAMVVDSFTQMAVDAAGFIEAMQQRRNELEEFHHELLNLDRAEPFFWQRVYALAGINTETKSSTFFDLLKRRLGFGAPLARTPDKPALDAEGRIALD
jgi:hypothetical protein